MTAMVQASEKDVVHHRDLAPSRIGAPSAQSPRFSCLVCLAGVG